VDGVTDVEAEVLRDSAAEDDRVARDVEVSGSRPDFTY